MEIKNNYSITNKVNYIDIKELVLMDKNPRKINKKNFEKLKTSLQNNKEFFEARPIICSNRTGKNIIIAGNQRYRAAKELRMKKVPCVIMTLSEEKEKEINIRDNVELGEWDYDILTNEYDKNLLNDWGCDFVYEAPILESINTIDINKPTQITATQIETTPIQNVIEELKTVDLTPTKMELIADNLNFLTDDLKIQDNIIIHFDKNKKEELLSFLNIIITEKNLKKKVFEFKNNQLK